MVVNRNLREEVGDEKGVDPPRTSAWSSEKSGKPELFRPEQRRFSGPTVNQRQTERR